MPFMQYTVVAKISRSTSDVEIGLFEGKAENGYK